MNMILKKREVPNDFRKFLLYSITEVKRVSVVTTEVVAGSQLEVTY